MFEDQLRLLETTDPECTHWTPLLPLLLGPESPAFIGGLYQTAFIAHHKAAAFGDYGLGDRRIDRWRPDELDAYFARYNIGWVVAWSPLSKFCFDRYPPARHARHPAPGRESPAWACCNDPAQWRRALVARAGPEIVARPLHASDGASGTTYKVYRVEPPPLSDFLEGARRTSRVDGRQPGRADRRQART